MDSHARPALTDAQIARLHDAIGGERARAVARVEAFERSFADIVASSEGSPPDDEHDPEGATIAFERAQVSALLDQSRAQVAELDAALARLRTASYGTCRRCGRPIAFERLLARPTATTCVACA
jgi:DnaK suppressor protein